MIAREMVVGRRGLPWKRLVGSGLGLAALVWLASYQDMGQMWRAVRNVDVLPLILTMPVILINMLLRAVRWRLLLGSRYETRFGSVFSALMIGYLANNVLPVRAGDLVRVYILGNDGSLSRSRILATVFLERVLDMAAIILVLALVAMASSLPDWLRDGATVLGGATVAGIAVLISIGMMGEQPLRFLLRPLEKRSAAVAQRLQAWAHEFAVGLRRFRSPVVGAGFFATTAVIWMLEIALVMLTAQAFNLPLTPLDAVVLMLFSLFSSLIPALPGQLGIFELAMITGLEFVGHGGSSALPFAFALHLVLLSGTALIGVVCLMYRGLPLVPLHSQDDDRCGK